MQSLHRNSQEPLHGPRRACSRYPTSHTASSKGQADSCPMCQSVTDSLSGAICPSLPLLHRSTHSASTVSLSKALKQLRLCPSDGETQLQTHRAHRSLLWRQGASVWRGHAEKRRPRSLECSEAAFMRVCRSARLACFSTACAALMCDSSRAALQHQSSAPQHATPHLLPGTGPSSTTRISSDAMMLLQQVARESFRMSTSFRNRHGMMHRGLPARGADAYCAGVESAAV